MAIESANSSPCEKNKCIILLRDSVRNIHYYSVKCDTPFKATDQIILPTFPHQVSRAVVDLDRNLRWTFPHPGLHIYNNPKIRPTITEV